MPPPPRPPARSTATPAGPLVGVVTHLNLGYTLLRTADGREIIVPNSIMATQVTVNLNGGGLRALAQVAFLAAEDGALPAAQRALVDVAGAQPEVLRVLGCAVLPVGAGQAALTVRAWCADANAARRVEAGIRRAGGAALRSARVVAWSTLPAEPDVHGTP